MTSKSILQKPKQITATTKEQYITTTNTWALPSKSTTGPEKIVPMPISEMLIAPSANYNKQ